MSVNELSFISIIKENLTKLDILKIADSTGLITNEEENFDSILDKLMRYGVSIITFFQRFTSEKLKNILTEYGIKKTGSKKDLIFRIISILSFKDYDVSRDDILLLELGEEQLNELKLGRNFEEIINNYVGSGKLDLLRLIVEFGGMVKEDDLKSKFVELGKEPISFYSLISALLRDKVISEREIEENKNYIIPTNIRAEIQKSLQDLEGRIKELEGKCNELPSSALMLLKIICNKAEKRTLKDIKQEFKSYFVSPQTWGKAKNLLKERNLIKEEDDEVIEDKVMYSPKMICPILGGLLTKYQDKLKETVEEKKCDISKITSTLKEISEGMLALLHLIINSGGNINKYLLKKCFTEPPGFHYSEGSYVRYMRDLKKLGLVNEEIEEDNGHKIKIITLNDDYKECIIEQISDRLLMNGTEFNQYLQTLPPSALNLAQITCNFGGSVTYQELRRNFLLYYSTPTWPKAFRLLENQIIFEGINEEGENLWVIPDKYLGEIEDYLENNEIKLPSKKVSKVTAEDFIINNVNNEKILRFAMANDIGIDNELDTIVNQLLYDKQIPLNILFERTIAKKQLSDFCKSQEKPYTGSKIQLIDRIIPLLDVSDNIQIKGTVSKEAEQKLEQIERFEEQREIEDDKLSKIRLDKDIIVDAIIENRKKIELKEFCKKGNLPYSGNMKILTDRILFSPNINIKESLDSLLSETVVNYIIQAANLDPISKKELVEKILTEVTEFSFLKKEFSLDDILSKLQKKNLMEICIELNIPKSGTKQQLISNIINNNSSVQSKILILIKKVPNIFDLVFNEFNIKFSDDLHQAKKELIEKLGGKLKEQEEEIKKEDITTDKEGLIKFLSSWINKDENFKEQFESLCETNKLKIDYNDLKQSINDIFNLYNEFAFLNEISTSKSIREMISYLDIKISNENKTSNRNESLGLLLSYFGIESMESIEQGIKILAKNLPLITPKNWAKIYVDLAYGKFESLKGIAEGREITEIVSPKNKSRIQGILFEWATCKLLEYMSKNSKLIMKFKPRITADNINQFSDYGEDGFLIIKGTKGNHVVLYDCKSYSEGYNIGSQIEKINSYIRKQKVNFEIMEDEKLSGFLIISSKFQGRPSEHIEKKFDPELIGKTKVILMQAKYLKDLFDEAIKTIEDQIFIHPKYNWLGLFQLETNQSTIIIKEESISEIMKDAKKFQS